MHVDTKSRGWKIEVMNDRPEGRQCVAVTSVYDPVQLQKDTLQALDGMPEGWQVIITKLR
jgi:hypothetical protein